MENEESEQIIEDESQQEEEINVLPVQLDETYETVSLSPPTNSSNIVRGKYYRQTYRQAWEHMPDFKGWLRGVTGEPTRAYCTYCQKTLHAHRLSLLKHTCTIRHQKAAQLHNSRKNKSQMHPQEVHAIVIQENDINQDDIENEDATAIEYAEASSDVEEEEQDKHEMTEEVEEEEDGISYELQVPFEKHPGIQQNYTVSNVVKPPLSTYVVDTTRGCPISGLQVSLYKLIDGRWTYINEGVTNSSGRFANFIDPADFTAGRYKLHYDVDRYFEARKQDTLYPFIEIILDCRDTRETYNIPILLSPFGYTTYRGS